MWDEVEGLAGEDWLGKSLIWKNRDRKKSVWGKIDLGTNRLWKNDCLKNRLSEIVFLGKTGCQGAPNVEVPCAKVGKSFLPKSEGRKGGPS